MQIVESKKENLMAHFAGELTGIVMFLYTIQWMFKGEKKETKNGL